MYKLLLFNKDKQDSFELEHVIEEHMSCFAERVENEEDFKRYLELRSVQLVIVNCKSFGLEELNLVNYIKADQISVPVIIVSNNNEFPDFFNSEREGKCHILYNPLEDNQFIGLAAKLLSSKKAPTQHFRRYRTDQDISLEVLSEGMSLSSKLYNLSLGGAYCEFFLEDERKGQINTGDLIRMNVEKQSGFHTLNAKVVWKKNLRNNDGVGVGLKFVKLQEL